MIILASITMLGFGEVNTQSVYFSTTEMLSEEHRIGCYTHSYESINATNQANMPTVYAGDALSDGTRDIGTIGFNAMCNITGKFGIVTNYHVAPVGTRVYLGELHEHAGQFLGISESGRGWIGGNMDAVFIPFVEHNWTPSPNVRYRLLNNERIINTVRFEYGCRHIVVNNSITRIGRMTNRTVGVITHEASDTIVPFGRGVLVTNTFQFQTQPGHHKVGGDSGGPIFHRSGNNYYLIGIAMSGHMQTSVRQNHSTRVSNIVRNLDITPITSQTLPGNLTFHTREIGTNQIEITGLRRVPPNRILNIPSQIGNRTVTRIGERAFENQTGLISVNIPETVTYIGNWAFMRTGITQIDLPNGLGHIGYQAFRYSPLTHITIPDSVNLIGRGAFVGVPLQSLTMPYVGGRPNSGQHTHIGYIFGAHNYIQNHLVPHSLRSVVLTRGTAIAANAFRGTTISSVVIPQSVTSISRDAFLGWTQSQHIFVRHRWSQFGFENGWSAGAMITFETSPFELGTGASYSPFAIWNATQFNNIRFFPNAHFQLWNDINLSGMQWEPIPNFFGTLNGNGRNIHNMRIVGRTVEYNQQAFGLFANNNGTIQGIAMYNPDIYFNPEHGYRWSNVGVFAGRNRGTIFGVATRGGRIVVHRQGTATGGIAGINYGLIEHATVYHTHLGGNGDTGGIAGVNMRATINITRVNHSTIHHFYVHNDRSIGGTVGFNYGSHILNSRVYNTTISNIGTCGRHDKAPAMGAVVGFLRNGVLRSSGSSNVTLNYGHLQPHQRSNFAQIQWEQIGGNMDGINSIAYPHQPLPISNAQQLSAIRYLPHDSFRLVNSINLGGIQWQPIRQFFGRLDGHHFSIYNLTITHRLVTPYNREFGLFARNNGHISNLHMRGVNIFLGSDHSGTWSYAGAISAINYGVITGVSVRGRLEMHRINSALGGITGINIGVIDNSVTENTTLVGNGDTGGISGANLNGGIIRYSHVVRLHIIQYVVNLNQDVPAHRRTGGIVGASYHSTLRHVNVFNTFFEMRSGGFTPSIRPRVGIIVGEVVGGTVYRVGASLHDVGWWYYPRFSNAQRTYFFRWGWGWAGRNTGGTSVTSFPLLPYALNYYDFSEELLFDEECTNDSREYFEQELQYILEQEILANEERQQFEERISKIQKILTVSNS